MRVKVLKTPSLVLGQIFKLGTPLYFIYFELYIIFHIIICYLCTTYRNIAYYVCAYTYLTAKAVVRGISGRGDRGYQLVVPYTRSQYNNMNIITVQYNTIYSHSRTYKNNNNFILLVKTMLSILRIVAEPDTTFN